MGIGEKFKLISSTSSRPDLRWLFSASFPLGWLSTVGQKSVWEIKLKDTDVQHNTAAPGPGGRDFLVGRTQPGTSNGEDYYSQLHKSHTTAEVFLNYKPI